MSMVPRQYIITNPRHMDSTMIYQLVLEQLHQKKQLLNLLPSLHSLNHSDTRIATHQMNDQQLLAQIHKSVARSLHHERDEREQLLQDISDEGEQAEMEEMEPEEEYQGEGEGEEDNDWEGKEGEGQEDPYGPIDEEENEEEGGEEDPDDDILGNEEAYEGEEDVDLYGEQIDEDELQEYQNEGNSEDQLQFEEEARPKGKKGRKNYKSAQQEEEDEDEDLINDQFDHFREVELQNKGEEKAEEKPLEKTQLQQQIESLEDKVISKKDWVLRGEVKATQRPINSLLEHDLQFKTGIKTSQDITPEVNSEIETMIKQRILDELYDDRVRYQHSHVLREQFSSLKEVSREKSKMGLGELYQSEFKNYLGLGEKKDDKLKKEVLDAFKEVNYYLDSLSNFNFVPRSTTVTKADAVISEEKVPLSMFNGGREEGPNISRRMKSEKEEDNKGKRLKNKRIARQRKKEVDRKKLNKKIEYGGMTKFESKAIRKGAKNNSLNKDPVKYNQSTKFFSSMNQEKQAKPNPT